MCGGQVSGVGEGVHSTSQSNVSFILLKMAAQHGSVVERVMSQSSRAHDHGMAEPLISL